MAQLQSVPSPAVVNAELHRILESSTFNTARRSQRFLSYLVEHALTHPADHIKEYSVALDVFERDPSYDPSVDATVRVEAGRLRSRLRDYYAGQGREDPLMIDVPKGGYSAVFLRRAPADELSPPEPPPADELPPSTAAAPVPPRAQPLSQLSRPVRWMLVGSFLVGGLVGFLAAL